MTTRGPDDAAATQASADDVQVAANDTEPNDGTSFQDGSTQGAMSDDDDASEDAATTGAGEDDADDVDASEGSSPKLQRKLREAAEAKKRLTELESKLPELEQAAKAFQTLLSHPNPGELLKQFKAFGGDTQAPDDTLDRIIPQDAYGFDAETKKGLDAYVKDAFGRLVATLKSDIAPMAKEIGVVKTQREGQEWSALTESLGPGIGKWESAAKKAAREHGIPLKKALAFVSDGEAFRVKEAKQAASAAAARMTPTLDTTRSRNGTKPKRPLALNFNAFMEQVQNRR